MKISKEIRDLVLKELGEHRKLSVTEVAELIDVSDATVRRLFVRLEEEGLAIRVFGGIQTPRTEKAAYSFTASAILRTKEKVAIGNLAALEVSSNDQIFLDSGTTVLEMAKALVRRHEMHQLENIKVLTNSLVLAEVLMPYCKVVLIGGDLRMERKDVCGFIAEETLKRFHVRKAFLGCDALHFERGLMTTDEQTARMNEIIIQNTSTIYILTDASKIGNTSFVSYGLLENVDTCIVDNGISLQDREILTTKAKRLLIAEYSETPEELQ
ncbi:MAG: DeoR/GlpR family DNA-binding transcription regulator [Clostridia bacterium]|jgi:DeoR/GlpR family transcriptional regulator of sugar metabolism|nr:DeoR/GlpR family DNA-binding transcription regulator [Spirochaetia bacterium]